MKFIEKITQEQLQVLQNNVRNKELAELARRRIQAILLLEEGLSGDP